MKKLLIIEDNIMQSKQIINYVSQQIPTLKLYSMCYLGKKDILIIDKIKKELEILNYNFSHNGTRYLLEVIVELYKVRYNFNSNLEDNLKKNVYPIIARRHSKTTDTIYGNIKQATKQMLMKCEKTFISNYFHCRC